MSRFRRLRGVATGFVGALVAAGISFIATHAVVGTHSPKFELVVTSATTPLQITSTISSSASTETAALLYPGIQDYLWVTVTNPLPVDISLTSLSITKVTSPAGCPASSNLSYGSTLPLPSPATVAKNGGTAKVHEPISLIDTHSDQDSCQHGTFTFTYGGTAQYTDITTTLLASSANPGVVGQQVTYAATVDTSMSNEPSAPSGSIAFYDGANPITCAAGSATFNGTLATCKVTYGSVSGSPHSITAKFSSSDTTNYSNSTSSMLSETINQATTSTAVASNHNPSLFGQPVTYTATVSVSAPGSGTPTGYVEFIDGGTAIAACGGATGSPLSGTTATCAVTYYATGSHTITAKYLGDTNYIGSTSGNLLQTANYTSACINSTIAGGYTVAAGQAICITGRVNGGITVQSGGALDLEGATLNGGLSSSGATAIRVCGTAISGTVTVSSSSGFVRIGDDGDDGSPACAANSITGSVTLSNNTGGIEFSGNTAKSGVTITGNAGAIPASEDVAPEVEDNTITGSLSCSSNGAGFGDGGEKNTVSGSKTGQCAGSSF